MQDYLNDIIFNNKRPLLEEYLQYFNNKFPLLNELKNTEQDNVWHSEGNVFIHTNMVLSEIYNIIYSNEYILSVDDKQILILGAIFHDIAKTITTKKETRGDKLCILHPQHEVIGANYISSRLMNFDLKYSVILKIINLVKYHQMPKKFIIKENDERSYYNLAAKCPLNLLYLLEIADMKGRDCLDKELQLEYLDLFKLYAIEYNIFLEVDYNNFIFDYFEKVELIAKKFNLNHDENLYHFAINEYLQNNIHTPEEAVFKYKNLNKTKIIILSGISGSGKSHNIKYFDKNYSLISLDLIRKELKQSEDDQTINSEVVRIAHNRLKDNLRNKVDTIYDATNLRNDFRQKIINLCYNYNSICEIFYFQTSIDLAKKAMKNRDRIVDQVIIDKQIKNLQFPDLFEGNNRTKFIKSIII